MPQTYDRIDYSWVGFDDLPPKKVERLSLDSVLGDISGLKCLDLGCQQARWSCWLVHSKWAAHVTGIDGSETPPMNQKKLPNDQCNKLHFIESVVSKIESIEGIPGAKGSFDLVFGYRFLNSAPSYEVLVHFLRVINQALKSGGQFVGLVLNAFCAPEPFDSRYGISCEVLEQTPDGRKCRSIEKVRPHEIPYESYYYLRDKYEDAARAAGLGKVRWHAYVLPEGGWDSGTGTMDVYPEGYWDVYKLRPHFSILSCRRV